MNQSPCKEESRMKVWTWKNRKSPKQEPEGPSLKESFDVENRMSFSFNGRVPSTQI